MTLKAAVGIDYNYLGALQLALNDYNAVEERTQYHETLVKDDGSTTCVTIMYSTVEPVQTAQTVEKHEYIGHTGIDPTDPDWRDKWEAMQYTIDGTDVIDTADILSDGAHRIIAGKIDAIQNDREGT